MPVIVIPLPMKIRSQARDILSILTSVTAIHFRVLKESLKLIAIEDDMDAFADKIWKSLNEDNKVSLFVRYIDIATGKYESKIINKNK